MVSVINKLESHLQSQMSALHRLDSIIDQRVSLLKNQTTIVFTANPVEMTFSQSRPRKPISKTHNEGDIEKSKITVDLRIDEKCSNIKNRYDCFLWEDIFGERPGNVSRVPLAIYLHTPNTCPVFKVYTRRVTRVSSCFLENHQ